MTDEAIERATVAAETCGAGNWLTAYVDELITSPGAGDQARGLTITGLRRPAGDAERILSREWGNGFLGDVAAWARTNYRRAVWAVAWLTRAATPPTPASTGAGPRSGCDWSMSDTRGCRTHCPPAPSCRRSTRICSNGCERRERRTKKRRDTLFGLRAPDRHVVSDSLVAPNSRDHARTRRGPMHRGRVSRLGRDLVKGAGEDRRLSALSTDPAVRTRTRAAPTATAAEPTASTTIVPHSQAGTRRIGCKAITRPRFSSSRTSGTCRESENGARFHTAPIASSRSRR